jgi:hypothetical protein
VNFSKRLRLTPMLLLIAILVALAIQSGITFAQRPADSRYFPETRKTVEGPFLEFYEAIPNPEFVYGFPITFVLNDPVNRKQVQYFQRARFELEDGEVKLADLGTLLLEWDKVTPLALPVNASACLVPAGSNYPVCYAFLDFFRAHGGAEQFGRPISGFLLEGDRLVQYFERARLAWHPENAPGQRVKLGDLGKAYFEQTQWDLEALDGESRDFIIPPPVVLNLRVRAFTDKAVVGTGEKVVLYAIVQDQTLEPVESAQVTFTVTTPGGERQALIMNPTDEHGITRMPFSVLSQNIGVIDLLVEARFNGLEETTRTSFRLWW